MKLVLVCYKYGVQLNDPCCYPLGFMYISAALKDQGHDVTVLNYNLWDYDFTKEIKGADAVLFTGFEEFRENIIRDATICREQGIKTIIGGALATFATDEMMPHVDSVVIGEGEAALERALTENGIFQGPKPCLEKLPLPDYAGFGIEEYHRRHSLKYMGVLTSRGCPYSCRFCAHTCSFRTRKLSAVFDEIDTYKSKYRLEYLVFNDNTLNLSKPRFLEICRGMKTRGLGWSSAIRVDCFDDEMSTAAKDSGCQYFVVGVESFLQPKLNAMKKMTTREQIISTLELLHKHKIGYHGNILTGLPGETVADIVDEINAIPPGYNVFPMLVQPFVGTAYQTRSISDHEAAEFSACFKEYAGNAGLNCYPEVRA